MKNLLKKSVACAVAALLLLSLLTGCVSLESLMGRTENDDIIILFTGDVHCGIDDYVGYSGLVAYKKYCESVTPYTTLVDCGDAVQGGMIGTVSRGEYIVDIMNYVGYDFAALGNHEFDFGLEQLETLIEEADAEYLACNISYSGSGENVLKDVKPYEIVEYGDRSVAFIGVSTPQTITSAAPTIFMEDGKFVYSFDCGGEEAFYATVQGYVDECEEKGADYVVVLSHLGDTEENSPYSSVELIEKTTGIDAVLDGHQHSVIPNRPVKDKNGDAVMLSATGTKLANIGQLTITEGGSVTTTLVTPEDWENAATNAYIGFIESSYEEQMKAVVGRSDVLVTGYAADGARLVRNRETAIGNFCADAYRAVTGADIGLVNGGGVRADLAEGDLTYEDMYALHPFGNRLCMMEATGQEILDALEVSYCNVQAQASENGVAIGENGEFLQVSGLRLTIDTSIESPVRFDSNGMVEAIDGTRRVKDVTVLDRESGEYLPIDPTKTYTVASHNYLIKQQGGNHDFFSDNTLLIDEGMNDLEVIVTYLTDTLDGVIGEAYAATEDRIKVQ